MSHEAGRGDVSQIGEPQSCCLSELPSAHALLKVCLPLSGFAEFPVVRAFTALFSSSHRKLAKSCSLPSLTPVTDCLVGPEGRAGHKCSQSCVRHLLLGFQEKCWQTQKTIFFRQLLPRGRLRPAGRGWGAGEVPASNFAPPHCPPGSPSREGPLPCPRPLGETGPK